MSPSESDGRRARGRRSRQQILDALADLVLTGEPNPASRVVADRAGVTQRTLFNHFENLEALFAEMGERQFEILLEMLPEPVSTGSFEDRIDAELDVLARGHERFGPILDAIGARPDGVEAIDTFQAKVRAHRRARLVAVLSAELEALGATAELATVALLAVTDGSTWSTLRNAQGCDVVAARSAVAGMVVGLLSSSSSIVLGRSMERVIELDVLDLEVIAADEVEQASGGAGAVIDLAAAATVAADQVDD